MILTMKARPIFWVLLLGALLFTVIALTSCDIPAAAPTNEAKVRQAAPITINTGGDGLTVEQRNVTERLKMDNQPGSIKHLYVISAYSGQTLIYSTVRGKVTSSGKRRAPSTEVYVGGDWRTSYNPELLGDDGTYGSSVEYIYWWDTKGVYHQHYIQGGQIVHISDQPLAVKSVVLNMETAATPATPTLPLDKVESGK